MNCRKEFLAMLELSEKVGSPNLTFQPGPVFESQGRKGSIDTLQAHLSELRQLKAGYRTSVSLEGHANTVIEESEVALDIIKRSWPDIGYTYDPSHFVMGDIPLRRTEGLLDYTVHVHVRNASLGKMQDTMANGKVDIEWLVSALKAHNFKGALSIEYFGDFDSDFENTLALQRRLVELGVEI
jgi:sugar phosphate isomerase/epimerase